MRHTPMLLTCLIALPIAASAAPRPPVAVAPGAAPGLGIVDTRCPTFHWTAVERAGAYEILVLEADRLVVDEAALWSVDDPELAEAVAVRESLPGAATGWTPSLEQCLGQGEYAWMIRARHGQRWGEWSEPGVFRVELSIDDERLRRVVRELLDERARPRVNDVAAIPRGPLDPAGAAGDVAPGTLLRKRSAGGGPTNGLRATSTNSANDSAAILGSSTATTGFVHGLKGLNASSGGPAIYGVNSAATSPQALAAGVRGDAAPPGGLGVYGFSFASSGGGAGVRGDANSSAGYGVFGIHFATNGAGAGVFGRSSSPSGYGGFFANDMGATLIAGSDGSQLRFKVDAGGSVFADGAYNCGGSIGDGAGDLDEGELSPCLIDDSPADFAEMLPAATGALEPGDVLALDEHGKLVAADSPFQRSVIGVVSTRPSYLGNSRFRGKKGFVPVALVRIVPVKVTAENGLIRAGDLLVASSTSGHAMRAGEEEVPQGSVIGKALGAMNEPTGMVRMVAMLQ